MLPGRPRTFNAGCAVVAVALLSSLLAQSGSNAKLIQDDPEATISALETRVAEQATVIAKLQAGEEDSPMPTVDAARTLRAERDDDTEPILLGNGLQLDYYYLVDDGNGNVRLVGEVSNGGEAAVAPHLRFVLYDDIGNVIDALDASSPLPALLPSGSVPIEGFVGDVSTEEIASEQVSLCETSGDPTEYGSDGLELRSVVEEDRDENAFRVRGQVFNARDAPAERVTVRALVFRADGLFAGSGATLIQAAIPPQRSARFDLLVTDYDMAGLRGSQGGGFSYELWAGTTPGVTVYSC